MVILTYGFETAYFRFSQKQENKSSTFSTAFISLAASALVFTSILMFFAPAVAEWIQLPGKKNYIYLIGGILLFDVLSVIPFAQLRLESKATKYAGIKILNILVNVILNTALLWIIPFGFSILPENAAEIKGLDIGLILMANLAASLITFFVLMPSVFKQNLKFDAQLWKKMWSYAWPLLLVGIAAMINEVLDRILLKFLLEGDQEYVDGQIGIYNACYKLAILMTLFTQAYRMAVEPFFFRAAEEKNAKTQYAKLMNYFVAGGALIFLGVMFFIDLFKYLIPNPDYWEGLKVVPILLLANFLLGIYYNLSVWYKLTDKTIFAAIISIAGAGLTVIANLILIPKIGYMGSAWATLGAYALMTLLSYFLGRKHYRVPYNLNSIFITVLIAAAFFALDLFVFSKIENISLLYGLRILLLFVLGGWIFVQFRKEIEVK